MSDLQTALVISGTIFVTVVLTALGRREYSWHKVLFPILAMAGFGYAYLRDVPTNGSALWLYAAGIGIGAIFAALATLATGLERDGSTGKLYTRCGAAFVITWLVAVALRIGFVWGVENVSGFRNQVGIFMMNHQITESAIAPFFVLMAFVTVLGRLAALQVRISRLGRRSADLQVPVAAAV